MKKENVVRKVLVSSLAGFPIGVTVLMICYASVYFVVGNDMFQNEISQLQNIQTLIFQIIISGIIYYILFIGFNIYEYIQNEQATNNYMAKHPYKTIIFTLTVAIFITIIACILPDIHIYSNDIGVLYGMTLLLVYALGGFIISEKHFKDSHLVKEINAKLKEKNK